MKIAIAGKAGSGKTTLAEFFVKKYGFTRTGFANAVKKVGMDEFGLSYEEAFGAKKNRTVLQDIGHGRRVEFGENYWVNKFLEQTNGQDNLIVDDMRYRNEFITLKDNGYILIRIDSPEEIRQNRIPNTYPENPNHPSETDLDDIPIQDWDVFIKNTSSLDYLEHCAEKIYEAFIKENDNV